MKKNCKLGKFAITAVIITAFVIPLSGCSFLPKEEDTLAPPLIKPKEEQYQLYRVVRKDIVKDIKGLGNLVSVDEKTVSFSKPGIRLSNINVKAGDAVKKGDLLAQADSGDLENKIEMQQLEVQKKQIQLQFLKDEYSQYESNPSQNPNFDSKAAEKDIKVNEIDLQEANLTLTSLKKQYADYNLTSPIDGVVSFVTDAKNGDTLDAYKAVVTVSSPKGLQIYFQSDSVVNVRNGMAAKVTYNGKVYDGKVVLTPDNVPSDEASKYKNAVLIDVPNLPSNAKLGESVDIDIPLQNKTNVLVVPENALQRSMGNASVQIMEGSSKKQVNVDVGIETSSEAEIVSGLQEGQMVILK